MAKLTAAEIGTIQTYRDTYSHQGQRTLARTIVDRGAVQGRSFATIYNAIRRIAGSIGKSKAVVAAPVVAKKPEVARESSASRC